MAQKNVSSLKNYGSTTVGERGQVVIPKEIRKEMKIRAGDKFFVFSRLNKVIVFLKAENFDTIISEMTKTLENLKRVKK
ncbi:MAG: AbrB/MazE/SpoVT family DNA-binding domain-containing protein [Candidatus Parcubacteria bacterium]|nr:AbrB/MazE/SpoVT family DNA-binding domain-containing protein [Candidatus Parcubacteria bacterium]